MLNAQDFNISKGGTCNNMIPYAPSPAVKNECPLNQKNLFIDITDVIIEVIPMIAIEFDLRFSVCNCENFWKSPS